MARDSRPPGFDMSFRPERPRRFGVPLRELLPSYGYLAITLLFAAFVAYGHVAPDGSFARYHVLAASQGGGPRAATFAFVVLASGLAAVLRVRLRGVKVHAEGIELVDALPMGVPRVRSLAWPMIDRFRFEGGRPVGVDLWNGTREYLPVVDEQQALVDTLVYIAEARAIPYVESQPPGLR